MRKFYAAICIYIICFVLLFWFANYFMSSTADHFYALFISMLLIIAGGTITALLWSNIFQYMYQIEKFHGIIYAIIAISMILVFPVICIYRSTKDVRISEERFNAKFTKNVDSVFNTLKMGMLEYDTLSKSYDLRESRILIGEMNDGSCTYNYEMTKRMDSSLIAFNVDSADFLVIIGGYEELADGKKYEDGTYAYRYITTISFLKPEAKKIVKEIHLRGQNPPTFIHRTDSRCGEHISNDSVVNYIRATLQQI